MGLRWLIIKDNANITINFKVESTGKGKITLLFDRTLAKEIYYSEAFFNRLCILSILQRRKSQVSSETPRKYPAS